MNETTKQFFLKLYLEDWTNGSEYVDWAFSCLEEGFDSKSLRLLAGLNKKHPYQTDFEELFRTSLNELDWKYLSVKEVLLAYAKSFAKQILSGEIEPDAGVEKVQSIYFRLGFPEELEYWSDLADGSSSEWEDTTWIPGVYKYNHEKWLEAVMREANFLVERDFS